LDVTGVDELIIPPALLSLTLGKIQNKITEVDGKVQFSRQMNIHLSGIGTVFQEVVLSELLGNIVNLLEQPLNISL
jgi:hypothetical protein